MKIHEYQAKTILARYGVTTPRGEVAFILAEGHFAARRGDAVARENRLRLVFMNLHRRLVSARIQVRSKRASLLGTEGCSKRKERHGPADENSVRTMRRGDDFRRRGIYLLLRVHLLSGMHSEAQECLSKLRG